jgi:hypothetical protein
MDPNLIIVLLGTFTITAYQPRPQDTKPECVNRHFCETSIGENVSELGLAVSQDLLKSGKVHYHDVIIVEGFSPRIVFDTMNPRIHDAMDMFVYTRAEEHKIGIQHRKVWLIHKGERQCNGKRSQSQKTHRAAEVARAVETHLSDTTVHSELK